MIGQISIALYGPYPTLMKTPQPYRCYPLTYLFHPPPYQLPYQLEMFPPVNPITPSPLAAKQINTVNTAFST